MSRFQTLYHETIVPELIKKFGYKTVMQVPRITKITLNMGVGEAVNDKKLVDNAVGDLTKIARPEACHHSHPQGYRELQDSRKHAHRLHGDPARRTHVRLP